MFPNFLGRYHTYIGREEKTKSADVEVGPLYVWYVLKNLGNVGTNRGLRRFDADMLVPKLVPNRKCVWERIA